MYGSANSSLANVSKTDIDWIGSARGLAGDTFDRFMIYGARGVAFAQTQIDGLLGSNRRTETGWTADGGVVSDIGRDATGSPPPRRSGGIFLHWRNAPTGRT